MGLQIASEAEFLKLMEGVNAELQRQDIPIHHRPIKGWFLISSRYGLGLRMPPSGAKPVDDSYEGDDLAIRIFDWFDTRCGDRLKADWGPGNSVIVIRGDAYRLVLPRVSGTVHAICDRSKHGQPNSLPNNVLNVLDCVDGLQRGLCAVLSPHELFQITSEVVKATHQFVAIEVLFKARFGPEARGDLFTSVECIVGQSPSYLREYGLSRWHSLHATEKIIKAYCKLKRISFTNTHDIVKLSDLVTGHGLTGIVKKHVRDANCDAKVRYGDVPSSFDQACNAHWAARSICAVVGKAAVADGLVPSPRVPCDLRLQSLRIV
ncbi:hypothetical protein [Dongia deserti]|uniref:hypothetical protein n=1 Tax=Dongia deserti TaxID=2268030 RepID=UPI0013C4FE4C|nr:hypothetical protein [Dongia deserti]